MREALENLRKSGKLTSFLYAKAAKSINRLPPHLQKDLLADAEAMSAIGVSSTDDLKIFSYIMMHGPTILKDIASDDLSGQEIACLSQYIFENRRTHPIDSIYKFYKAAENAIETSRVNKKAYPQGQGAGVIMPPHNVKKWMQTMRDIYALKNKGLSSEHAFNAVTKDWDIMEKKDFKHWMRFYEEGSHNRYKTAQLSDKYYASDGVMIPIDHLKADMPAPHGIPNMDQFNQQQDKTKEEEALVEEQLERERKEAIKKKINSIEGRLRAAETIIRKNPEVARELDKVLEMGLGGWLDLLTKIRLSIVKAPIVNAKSSILEDLLIRRGNTLIEDGCQNAGNLLISLAQVKPPTIDDIKNDQQKEEESQPPKDLPEGLPEGLPEEPGMPIEMADPEEEGEEAVREFINRLNNGGKRKEASDMADIIVFSQEHPRADIEVVEKDDTKAPPPDPFEGREITISDVISRLEAISDLLKNREIPRQLNVVDIELDKLNMASLFPSLAEATRSALESNQYMVTRIDEILSKLRGMIESSNVKIDLAPDKGKPDALDEIREGLVEQDKKEEEARQKRDKKRINKELGVEPTAPEVPPELEQPAQVESGTPTRIT